METGRDTRVRGDADALTGILLDRRYRIGAKVARGGMASVYEAIDTRLDRTVAVKVMHPGLADDGDFAARFVREARAAARLTHPNVVGVYDQGEDDGTVYLVMEYVPGRTLRDVVRAEAPLLPLRALSLVEPVLSALATAHRAGMVHRDVKPENVLIAEDGRVTVADFGLAKAVSADTQHTATGGVLIGTVSYLAPELVVHGRGDARADVYAVGIMLYELLTGRKPHQGDSPIHVAYQHVHADVPPPSRLVPGLPAYLDALVARATARDPHQRPADAGVLLHQLHRVRQALAEGVREDPELTTDLTPLLTHADLQVGPDPGPPAAAEVAAAEVAAAEVAGAVPVRPTPVPARRTPEEQEAERPRRRSRRGPALLVVALLLAGLLGYAAWWFGVARYTLTPGVLGLSQAAAERELDEAGLAVRLGEPAFSETVDAGRVLSTDPAPGDRVLDGGTVTVVLSQGQERYQVPRLAGLTEDQAQDALAGRNLAFGGSTERFSETVAAGEVIASNPDAGASLRRDAVVDVIVSKGRRPIRFGDWSGRDAGRAETVLRERGLRVVTGEQFSDSVPEGRVVSQAPSSGPLFRGQQVTLVVSKGPDLVAVPDDLVAAGVDAATTAGRAAGLEAETARSESYLGLGFVFSVSPGEGQLVPRGSTVTLYLI